MLNVIIYGKNSYIGNQIKQYLSNAGEYDIKVIDSQKVAPEDIDYCKIDCVIDVAGIAHVKITNEMKPLFFKVNRDLAISLCKQAKLQGVRHFIYFSSMNVYGDTTQEIDSLEQVKPKNFYGQSKLEADIAIQAMNDDSFKVASIRPPVVYGRGCKGNFVLLEKISKYVFLVPKLYNKKSIIYIDNLCEFVKQILENNDSGIFHPQNKEVTSTIQIITALRRSYGKKTLCIYGFNWVVKFGMKISNTIFKAFANDYYSQDFSKYRNNTYCKYDFYRTIELLTGGNKGEN